MKQPNAERSRHAANSHAARELRRAAAALKKAQRHPDSPRAAQFQREAARDHDRTRAQFMESLPAETFNREF